MTHFHLVQLKPLYKYRPHLTMLQTLVQLHEQTCSLWFFLALMARHNSIRRLSQVEITKHVVYGLKTRFLENIQVLFNKCFDFLPLAMFILVVFERSSLHDEVNRLLDILEQYKIISPVNKEEQQNNQKVTLLSTLLSF